MSDAENRDELLALRLSFVLTALFAVGAFAIALTTDSETMSLEALTGLVDVVVALIALFVARVIHKPADDRYHFGYGKYEPMMIALEGTLLVAVCLNAIADSLRDLIHADPVDAPYLVIIYTFAGFVLSLGFGVYMRRLGQRAGSPLVVAEAHMWIIDGWLSLGVCAAFVAAAILTHTSTIASTAYIDPAVCIVLSLILLRKPAQLLRESFDDLVDANPYPQTLNTIEQAARACVERYGLTGLEWVRLRKAGRRLFVLVSFFEPAQASMAEMERIRGAVTADLVGLIPEADVSVLFRADGAPVTAS